MEKYTRNARFCLICNYVSKIIPALQSRCTRFRFQPLPEQFVRNRLDYICQQEGCALPCRPSPRRAALSCPSPPPTLPYPHPCSNALHPPILLPIHPPQTHTHTRRTQAERVGARHRGTD